MSDSKNKASDKVASCAKNKSGLYAIVFGYGLGLFVHLKYGTWKVGFTKEYRTKHNLTMKVKTNLKEQEAMDLWSEVYANNEKQKFIDNWQRLTMLSIIPQNQLADSSKGTQAINRMEKKKVQFAFFVPFCFGICSFFALRFDCTLHVILYLNVFVSAFVFGIYIYI